MSRPWPEAARIQLTLSAALLVPKSAQSPHSSVHRIVPRSARLLDAGRRAPRRYRGAPPSVAPGNTVRCSDRDGGSRRRPSRTVFDTVALPTPSRCPASATTDTRGRNTPDRDSDRHAAGSTVSRRAPHTLARQRQDTETTGTNRRNDTPCIQSEPDTGASASRPPGGLSLDRPVTVPPPARRRRTRAWVHPRRLHLSCQPPPRSQGRSPTRRPSTETVPGWLCPDQSDKGEEIEKRRRKHTNRIGFGNEGDIDE